LFRREWRQQVLVGALLILAVAGTVVGLGVAANSGQPNQSSVFGLANTIIQLPGSDLNLSGDVAAIGSRFGTVDVIAHQNVPVPGSVSSIDLRAEDPHGRYSHVTLRLDSGASRTPGRSLLPRTWPTCWACTSATLGPEAGKHCGLSVWSRTHSICRTSLRWSRPDTSHHPTEFRSS
jgi:hypothetical protein